MLPPAMWMPIGILPPVPVTQTMAPAPWSIITGNAACRHAM